MADTSKRQSENPLAPPRVGKLRLDEARIGRLRMGSLEVED